MAGASPAAHAADCASRLEGTAAVQHVVDIGPHHGRARAGRRRRQASRRQARTRGQRCSGCRHGNSRSPRGIGSRVRDPVAAAEQSSPAGAPAPQQVGGVHHAGHRGHGLGGRRSGSRLAPSRPRRPRKGRRPAGAASVSAGSLAALVSTLAESGMGATCVVRLPTGGLTLGVAARRGGCFAGGWAMRPIRRGWRARRLVGSDFVGVPGAAAAALTAAVLAPSARPVVVSVLVRRGVSQLAELVGGREGP
mmetsp:Transcript_2258/g.8714  ORF Transcript_2258/g.8714 Transcript_2258/m.8714 type:complete len:250 (-) Transcript_2258:367-1116(-)